MCCQELYSSLLGKKDGIQDNQAHKGPSQGLALTRAPITVSTVCILFQTQLSVPHTPLRKHLPVHTDPICKRNKNAIPIHGDVSVVWSRASATSKKIPKPKCLPKLHHDKCENEWLIICESRIAVSVGSVGMWANAQIYKVKHFKAWVVLYKVVGSPAALHPSKNYCLSPNHGVMNYSSPEPTTETGVGCGEWTHQRSPGQGGGPQTGGEVPAVPKTTN